MTDAIDTVGFVVTPDEIADRVRSLDAAIGALESQVMKAPLGTINTPWRNQFNAFVRRWAVERSSYADWGSRLFATRAIPRIEAFEKSYRWWAADLERRTKTPVKGAAFVTPTGLIPWWVWAVGAGVLYLAVKGARRG